MAEAFLRVDLAARGVSIPVGSAGFVTEGAPPPPEVVRVMADAGIDIAAHRSRRLGTQLMRDAALVVTMTGQHLVEVTAGYPEASGKSFTFAEVLDRGGRTGPRLAREPVGEWVGRVHSSQRPASPFPLSAGRDVADPMGGPLRGYEQVRDILAAMTARLAAILDPAGRPPRPAGPA